jgi:RNA polymerase sigma-70 factor (ECF subfamily)
MLRAEKNDWIVAFHSGNRETFERFYRDYFATVETAVGRVLAGADRETVIHEVFYHLMTRADVRRSFSGGSIDAWVAMLAKNRAIDFARRRQREQPTGIDPDRFARYDAAHDSDPANEAKLMIAQFKATVLPKKWEAVFETRFVQQLEQREAAAALGMSRTTLAYQEHRIRTLLRRFVLRGG